MARAVRLEFSWSKEQILEAYLNLAPFRGEIQGIRAAARGFFEKSPRDLHSEESALLVALLRAPNAATEKVASRACALLKPESCATLAEMAGTKLAKTAFSQRTRALLPVFSEQIRAPTQTSERGEVRTTLSRGIQELAVHTLGEQLEELLARNVRDGAVLVLDNATGEALAYVSNGGWERSSSVAVDGVQALRQAGSTLKTFIYATGIERRIFDLRTLLLDSPENITVAFGKVYQPKNYDHTFRGRVSVAEALGSSLNVPAVRALALAGERETLENLKALGFRDLKSEDDYGPSLALGSVDLTLWDLTHAYRRLHSTDSPYSQRTREAIFAALSGPEYRRFTFGTESALKLPFPAAVKTGTSKDMRDNWCVGYSDRYTVGAWVGNFSGEPMRGVSGMSGAAPIWRKIMLALHGEREGTLPRYEKPEEALEQPTLSKIKYPAPDMLVGLDPDIPEAMQRLPIEIEHPLAGQRLFLNGKALGSAQETVLWPIRTRGEYVVELRDSNGRALDQVRFFVR
jgi:penicillin-binding protein 1C